MFIGRERELATLNKLYASDKFEFVVIYGRRRVGKTALISQFIDDKNAIYFMGVESNAKQNLENFSKSIMSYHTGMDAETSFLSFQAALEYVFKLSEKERIILAIDEYPYVARSSKSLASTIQLLIDQYKDTYDHFAWTVAMAPADNPKIAVVALLVQGGMSYSAAPIVREVIGEYLQVDTKTKKIDISNKMN